jgi:hypothetical protein
MVAYSSPAIYLHLLAAHELLQHSEPTVHAAFLALHAWHAGEGVGMKRVLAGQVHERPSVVGLGGLPGQGRQPTPFCRPSRKHTRQVLGRCVVCG